MSNNTPFTIYPPAQEYIAKLVAERGVTSVCLFVDNPNTPQAETCLCYFDDVEDKDQNTYKEFRFTGFCVFVDTKDEQYLKAAEIDLLVDDFGSQLTIKAPNAKQQALAEDATVAEQIEHMLHWEINPSLASHGGHVQLVRLEQEDTIVVLQFGGGCQGCSMIDTTLKDGIEAQLLARIPQLKQVKDITDHSDTTAAYYSSST